MTLLLLLAAALLAAGLLGLKAVRAYQAYAVDFHPSHPPLPEPPPGASDVAFGDPGEPLRGWYWPSRSGAAVLLCHGTETDRRQLAPEAALLAAQGFGVLAFDFPGHGQSGGRVHWDAPERAAIRHAVDFLAAQPGVDPQRLGALGFSMGGYVLASAAVEEPRLRALVLASTFTEPAALARNQLGRLAPLLVPVALLAERRHGMHVDEGHALQALPRLAGRPLLLVAGEQDGAAGPQMARALFAAAREPRELWLVPGAGHGDFLRASPTAWPQRLTDFFARTLAQDAGALKSAR